MIEVRNLCKIYRMKRGVDVTALDDVSLKFPDTGMVFILGKSGSGKSTLLNVIGGLDTVDSGEILVKGSSCADFKQSHYDSYRNTYIGFIFQEYNILEELTVGANIALAIELQGRRAEDEEINRILEEVDLAGYGDRKPNELSGGQKQRVAIARALVKHPEIIMADEPTGALDSETGKQVFDTLKRLSRDKLVLIVSHDREFSEQYADRIIELSDGKVISDVELVSEDVDIAPEAKEEESALSYEEDGIKITAGYQLTEEDRIAINAYLKAHADGVKINVKKTKAGIKRASYTNKQFKPTDESQIVNKGGAFELIKSKLSIKNSFKIGSGALKYKKFRLVFTIFLSLISFTLFGLADTIAAYNSVKTTTSSLVDSGINYASFMKEVKYVYGEGSYDYYWMTDETYISADDIEKIKEETGLDVIGVYQDRYNDLSMKSALGGNISEDDKYREILYTSTFSGLAPITQQFIDEHGFTLTGRLPEKGKNEIVITDFMYEYFTLQGYLDKDSGKPVEINEHKDLIGKTIEFSGSYMGKQKIVGILDTEFDLSRFEPLTDKNAQNSMNMLVYFALVSELESARAYSYACLLFVEPDIITELAAKNEGEAEPINGNLSLRLDSSKVTEKDYEYYMTQLWFQYLQALSNYNGDIYWIDGEKTSLAENEIIIPADRLLELISIGAYNEKLYDSEALIGFERTLRDNWNIWSLSDIIYNLTRCTAVKFASNNIAKAKEALKKANYGSTWTNDEDVIRTFSDNIQWDPYMYYYLDFDKEVEAYRNELIEKYGLENSVTPSAVIDKLDIEKTIDGNTYYAIEMDYGSLFLFENFRTQLSSIIPRKYTLENYEEAKRFCGIYNGVPGGKWSADDVINTYIKYLYGEIAAPEGYTSSVESYSDYYCRHIHSIYSELVTDADTVSMEWNSWLNGKGDIVSDIKIAGLVTSRDGKAGNSFMILDDAMASSLLGPNRGGIYRFVIAEMPEGESAVRDIVEFSKYEHDGEYKFSIQNSVTQELSYVEGILEILGQVFLYVGIAFALFASLMLTNFIGTSISYKKHDIGILRAIGSRSADVFRIFFAESFIIAMINFVLSASATFGVTFLINNILRNDAGLLITFLSFGVRQIGLLFLVSLFVAFIATFFPVRKIARKKPIDAIKNLR